MIPLKIPTAFLLEANESEQLVWTNLVSELDLSNNQSIVTALILDFEA